jgi:hypothetical protein
MNHPWKLNEEGGEFMKFLLQMKEALTAFQTAISNKGGDILELRGLDTLINRSINRDTYIICLSLIGEEVALLPMECIRRNGRKKIRAEPVSRQRS